MKNFKIWLIVATICALVLFFSGESLGADQMHFPMDITAKVTDTSQLPDGYVTVAVTISIEEAASQVYVKSAKVQISLISGNSSIDPQELTIGDLMPGSPKTVEFKVKPALGNTEIGLKVPASDSSRPFTFYAVTTFCLVWDGKELLSGQTVSHAIIDKLKKDYAEGRITKERFDCEYQRSLTAGEWHRDCSKF